MENDFANDKDLKFLYDCPNDRLKLLVDVIIYDKDGKPRISETLSNNKIFRENYPSNIKAMLPEIINELQCFGGNSIRNAVRGHGVSYREILEDVCKQQGVNYNKGISTELLERFLLQKILLVAADKMTEEDIEHLTDSKKMTKELLMQNITFFHIADPLIIRMVTTAVIKIAGKQGFAMLGAWATAFAGSRVFSILTGPIGWALATVWTIYDVAGPAYRVTVPATIMIAYFRMIASKSEEELEQILS